MMTRLLLLQVGHLLLLGLDLGLGLLGLLAESLELLLLALVHVLVLLRLLALAEGLACCRFDMGVVHGGEDVEREERGL